jgi:NDP-sugar pyrophosphorylase family protein
MQAVILAGGLGTRLRPLTDQMPKVMVSLFGKPFLGYQLELLKGNEITDIVLCIGYHGNQIKGFFGDGGNFGIRIRYSEEREGLLGTGGALKQAQNLLDNHFFVINGDTYLPIGYREVENLFLKRGEKALMVVYNNEEHTGVRNNVELDDHLMVIRHDKGRLDSKLRYVEAGVLVLKREALDIIPAGQSISLERGLYPTLIQQRELAACITDQRFYDIGCPEQLKVFAEFLERGLR